MKLLFSLAILLNAALIFWVELLFGKKLLPVLGGSPAVWNTCLMFYQVLLLGGYAYALFLDRLPAARQVALHGVILAAAMVTVPWSLFLWSDPGGRPVLWLLGLLFLSVGPPFFVLAAGAPILQRWFSHAAHRESEDPYFLYAASNLGSFAALAAYPLLVEPTLTLSGQGVLWKVSFVAVGILVLLSGVLALRAGAGQDPRPPRLGSTGETAEKRALTARRRLRWIGLAFVPSSLLLGVTTHITSEIAPVPLLWIVPLAIYLLTFVVAFGPGRHRPPAHGRSDPAEGAGKGRRRTWFRVGVASAGVLLVGAAIAWAPGLDTGWLLIVGDLAVLSAAGLVCHTRLARDRPSPARLAEYYLFVAAGGALGGVFNTLVAPTVFTDPLEYPLVLAFFAFIAGSASRPSGDFPRVLDVALGLLPAILAMGLPMLWSAAADRLGASAEIDPLLLLAIPGALCLALAGRPVRFGLGVAGLVFVGFVFPATGQNVAFKERSFFGIHRIYFEDSRVWLAHGTTVHGGQDSRDPGVPLTYYHPDGPAGSLFRGFYSRGQDPGAARIGVVGLGTGSLVAYSRPGQSWTFFELDPTVARIAEDSRYFIFLAESWAPYRTVIGDGRLSLEAEASDRADRYDLIVVDAFSSDAIPVHLLTREAMALYRERLRPGGWIAFHTSNRFADFSGVLAELAGEAGLSSQVGTDLVGESAQGRYPSQWVLLSEGPVTLDDPRWRPMEAAGSRVWTDAYSSMLQILRR